MIPKHILSKVAAFGKSLRTCVTSIFSSEAKALDGTLTATLIYADGTKKEVLNEKNLILLASKQTMLSTLYSPSVVVNNIATLQIGTGGAVDPQGLFPKTVSQSLTSLFAPTVAVPVSFTQDLTIPSVTFIADIDQATANGSAVTEAGLRYASGGLFNIKTFPAIPKTADFSIHFEWTIRIS